MSVERAGASTATPATPLWCRSNRLVHPMLTTVTYFSPGEPTVVLTKGLAALDEEDSPMLAYVDFPEVWLRHASDRSPWRAGPTSTVSLFALHLFIVSLCTSLSKTCRWPPPYATHDQKERDPTDWGTGMRLVATEFQVQQQQMYSGAQGTGLISIDNQFLCRAPLARLLCPAGGQTCGIRWKPARRRLGDGATSCRGPVGECLDQPQTRNHGAFSAGLSPDPRGVLSADACHLIFCSLRTLKLLRSAYFLMPKVLFSRC